jgi:signal transduction histidine kinase
MPDPIEFDPSVMTLLAGLAHEINTPLGAIKSNNEIVDLAFRKIGEWMKGLPEATLKPDMEEILHIVEVSLRTNRLACERLIGIVGSVRNFARLGIRSQENDIRECIENTLAILAHLLKGRVEVVKDYGRVGQIDGYRSTPSNVYEHYSERSAGNRGRGKIRIKTWEAGNAVRIAISDTGRGISPDVLPESLTGIYDQG